MGDARHLKVVRDRDERTSCWQTSSARVQHGESVVDRLRIEGRGPSRHRSSIEAGPFPRDAAVHLPRFSQGSLNPNSDPWTRARAFITKEIARSHGGGSRRPDRERCGRRSALLPASLTSEAGRRALPTCRFVVTPREFRPAEYADEQLRILPAGRRRSACGTPRPTRSPRRSWPLARAGRRRGA